MKTKRKRLDPKKLGIEEPPPPIRQLYDVELHDGRVINNGDEFTVPYQGRFVFRWLLLSDGSLTAWGPITGSKAKWAQWRSFYSDDVTTIHERKTYRKANEE